MVPAVRALSYEDLNPTTTGTKLGIFVMTGSHTPIQDIWTGSLVLDTLTLLGGLVIGSCAGDGSDTLSVTGDTVTQISNCYALSKPLGRWAIPSDPRNIFASGSIWTKNWSANACPTSGLSVIMLNPGIDTIPATLAANTIYILNPGEYPVTRASTTSGSPCSAIIGKDHEDPISQLISYS